MTLTRPQLAAYGALGLPLAAAALPVYVHLPNLYGGVLGMNLALLGVVLLAARLADAFVDPLLGALADRLQRPRLLIALGVALLVAGLAAVFNPPGALWWWLATALVPVYLGYSLASIAYLLLTGTLPYTAKAPREMFTQLLSMPPIPLNKAKAGLLFPSQVEAVIMRALSKNPKDRYPDVLTFARALAEALAAANAGSGEGGFMSRVKGLFRGKGPVS